MYDRLIVPLDGSKLAETALPYAEELAGKMNSEIVLLSVLESGEADEYKKHQIYPNKMIGVTKLHSKKYLDKSAKKMVKVYI